MEKSRKKSVSRDAAVEPKPIIVDEEKSPFSIQYTFLDTINQGKELCLSNHDFGQSSQKNPANGPSSELIAEMRYRVQVFASNHIETVREQKKELEKKISDPVVIGYEAPYYKLYTGSFIKRQDAQAVLAKLKKLGFLDAWVVSTSVVPEN